MKRFEDFEWEFDEEDDDDDIQIGDKVKFKNSHNRIPTYFTDYKQKIPYKFIIHGQTTLPVSDYNAKVVDIYKEYYIVNFIDGSRNHTQLGFLKKDLIKI